MNRFVAAACAGFFFAAGAHGAAYSFTDQLSDGTQISGWFQATQSGAQISGFSDLAMFMNGEAFANNGQLTAQNLFGGDPMVSAHGSLNSFYVDDGAGHVYGSVAAAPFNETIAIDPISGFHYQDGTASFQTTRLQQMRFGFTDTYDNGMTVTGSVDGYQVGNVIFGMSDLTAKMNGIAFSDLMNPLAPNNGFFMSLDGTQNNFSFSFGGSGPFGYFEDVASGPFGAYHDAFLSLGGSDYLDAPQFVPHHFSITSISAIAVPEPASWVTMIAGFGMIGAMRRRHRRSTQAA